MLLGRGRRDVLGGENGEDEGLQGLNEDLQAEDRHAEDQGHHTGGLVDDRLGMQSRYSPPNTNTSTSRCPANILAKSRKDRVTGRTMMLDTNSSGMISGHMKTGTPEGKRRVLEITKETVLGDADAVVDHPDQDRQTVRPTDVRGRREQAEREDAQISC